MELWRMTLQEFLTKDCMKTGSTSITLDQFLSLLAGQGWHEGGETELESHRGFATAPLNRPGMAFSYRDQALLRRTEDRWNLKGMYVDDTVIVNDCVSGRGLGTELVLRCVPHRPTPQRRTVSPAGLATLIKAYYVGVGRALSERRELTPEIREAYENWRATRGEKRTPSE